MVVIFKTRDGKGTATIVYMYEAVNELVIGNEQKKGQVSLFTRSSAYYEDQMYVSNDLPNIVQCSKVSLR